MEIYDVCVIGSGPAGGVLSLQLAEAGAKVALVEAGSRYGRLIFTSMLGRMSSRTA
jgi:flavin-dependent dehydrogenase